MKVLIAPSSFGQLDPTPLKMLEDAGFEVVPNPYSRRYTKEEIIELLKGIDGLIAGLEPLNREVLETAPQLKALARCGAGMNNVDQDAAKELGIKVSNTPDGPTQSVAEMALGALLSAMRMIPSLLKISKSLSARIPGSHILPQPFTLKLLYLLEMKVMDAFGITTLIRI